MSSSAGKVLILPKGEYNNATQYQMLDAVRYNGSLYIAKKTTIGHVPADGEYWMLSAIGASDIHWGDITGSIANQSDLINALDAKQNVLTFDSTPTASSNNPVTSAGIKTALDTKQNTLTFDTTPTSGSTNPVTSDGIFTAVNATASNLATIESSTTASQAYSTGDYLVLNGQLYEVIADIASGETLVVGTNISARTVGEELTALNNGLNTSVSRIRNVATLLTQRLVPTSNTMYTLSESVSNFALIAVVCGWGNDNVLDTVVMPSAVWSSNKTDVVRLWGNRIPSANIYVDVKSRTETTLYCQSNNSNVSVGVYGILRVN